MGFIRNSIEKILGGLKIGFETNIEVRQWVAYGL
jgi:hypothetical protein